jgi:Nucleotidyltransferase of unknown function (DUF6036)
MIEDALSLVIELGQKVQVKYAFSGGIANAVWGIPRSTEDIDIVVLIEDKSKIQDFFKTHSAVEKTEEKDEYMYRVHLKENPFYIDILFRFGEYYEDALNRRVKKFHPVLKRYIYLLSPEDLIIFKLLRFSIKDRMDIAGVISITVVDEDYIKQKSSLLRGLWDKYIKVKKNRDEYLP